MPERPRGDGGKKPMMTRAQSLRAGRIHGNVTSEAPKKAVEPARFADAEKPRFVPEKPGSVWTPPSDTEEKKARSPSKKARKKNAYSKKYERRLTKPHRAIVSKSRERLEGGGIPSHLVGEVLGARIEITHVNEVKETCKAVVNDRELWFPMSGVMWLDKGWQDNMEDEVSEEYEPEEANDDHKSFHAQLYQNYMSGERKPNEIAGDSKIRSPEESMTKSSIQKTPGLSPKEVSIELCVIGEPEPGVEEEQLIEKEEVPPPPITTNDMIIDCCCCRSHHVRRARVEFWDSKTPEDLQKALTKMGIRDSIHDFAENEAVRQGLRSSAYKYRNLSEILLVAAIICLFVSASQFVSGTASNSYAIAGGILCACGLAFYHLASLRQTEYENRTEEVNQYIAKYKLNLEPHMLLGRLEENVQDLSSLDRRSLLGMAARSQR